MKDRIVAVVVIVALVAGVAVLVKQKRGSPQATRERMVEKFIAILPDSLGDEHILEIRQLFYTMSEREKLGKVKPETAADIDGKLAAWVEKGRIRPNELVHFMAEVGYSTYKDDEKYMLPDGSNDNPVLNPSAGMVKLGFDSTQYDSAFWADFEKWKKENPELVDSLMQEFYGRQGTLPHPPKGH
ncbi:MAG TPA: hypothetical protein VF247_08225 [Candidatus Krumholzibacteria bacterium]